MRPRRPLVVALAALVLVAALGAAYVVFVPKGAEVRHDPLPGDPADYALLAHGSWRGGDEFHFAQGDVRVLDGPDGRLLRFDGYDARDGPAVYFYLVEDANATSEEGVEGRGVRLASAELEGDFHLPLPADLDLSRYGALVAWCDTFDVLFGVAELAPP